VLNINDTMKKLGVFTYQFEGHYPAICFSGLPARILKGFYRDYSILNATSVVLRYSNHGLGFVNFALLGNVSQKGAQLEGEIASSSM
jgi:hypothetical protein